MKNWSVGAQRGREAQSARAIENLEGANHAFEFIAWKYRPTTREQFAQCLNEEGYPTPSGRSKWSGNLVNQYMRRLGQTPKSLLARFPESSGIGYGFRPEVYDVMRKEIVRLNAPSGKNGSWHPALEVEPRRGQTILHPDFGQGNFLERISLTRLLCEFALPSPEGSVELVERKCRPADISVFVFHLSMEERYAAQIAFWKRVIIDEEASHRALIDGWIL